MLRISHLPVWAVLVAGLAAANPALARSVTVDREEHKTFEVAPGHRLELRHDDGNVVIEPWDQDVLDVSVRYYAEFKGLGAGNDPDFTVEFEQDGDTVRVRGRETVNWRAGIFVNRRYENVYRIKAPAYLVLDLVGDDGDVEITGWRAAIAASLDDGDITLANVRAREVSIDAEDGDVEIDDLEGALDIRAEDGDVVVTRCVSSPLQVETEDGDITIDDCRGDFELSADDGDVAVRGASVGRISVRASDGDVDLSLVAATELDLSIDTDDGGVALALADGISAEFEIEAHDGSIRVANSEWVRLRTDHRVTGQVGAAGVEPKGRIRIETDDGNVTLR